MDLFFENRNYLKLPNGELYYYPDFFSESKANKLFVHLKDKIAWQSYKIKIFGKNYDQPRLTAFYNDSDIDYSYSKLELKSQRLTHKLSAIKSDIESLTNYQFNSVLLNFYRDNKDSNGWHADNEKSLGNNPVIASLSLGCERTFHLKHNYDKNYSYKIKLKNGSLLIMGGEMQHYWKHQIPKTNKETGERINLTFRKLVI